MSLGRFRLCVLANAVYNSLGAGMRPRSNSKVGFEKEDQDLVSALGSLEECVLLSVWRSAEPVPD